MVEKLSFRIVLPCMPGSVEQVNGAYNICENEFSWIGNGTVYMGFSGQVYHGIKGMIFEDLIHQVGIGQYDRLSGKSAIAEACVNILAPLLGSIGLFGVMLRRVCRDFARYFDRQSDYASTVRERLRERLCTMLDRGDRVMLISHGTGSGTAYDVLWQLSHDPRYKDRYGDKKTSSTSLRSR